VRHQNFREPKVRMGGQLTPPNGSNEITQGIDLGRRSEPEIPSAPTGSLCWVESSQARGRPQSTPVPFFPQDVVQCIN